MVRRTRGWVVLGLGAALVAWGCSDDGGSGGGDDGSAGGGNTTGTTSIPLEDLPGEAASALCAAYANCVGPLFDAMFAGESCETRVETQLSGEFGILADIVEAGGALYYAELAPACLRVWEERDCADLNQRSIAECEDAIQGTVEVDGECTTDWECVGFNICKFNGECPGTCTPRGSAGTACERDDECRDGLICFDVTGRCVEPIAEDGACGGGVEPECAPGLFCLGADDNAGTAGTCVTMDDGFSRAAGASCGVDTALCEPGLSCVVLEVVGEELTMECAEPVDSGDACRIGFPEQCPTGEYCAVATGTLEGTCEPLPGDGEPCAQRFEDRLCAPWTRCDEATGNCRTIQELGGTCSGDALCYSENCVDGGCAPSSACEP